MSTTEEIPPRVQLFFKMLFPSIFILVGVATIITAIPDLIKANASRGWPKAEGKVIESTLGSGPSTSRSRGSIYPEVHYDFSVNGKSYTGKKFAYGFFGSGNSKGPTKIINRYPKGKAVTAYYMPENPEESVLEPGIKMGTCFLPCIGLPFFVFGCFAAWFMFKPRKQVTEHEN